MNRTLESELTDFYSSTGFTLLLISIFSMRCSRCRRWIESREIKFAREGDWMGKPLCRKCKAEVEGESRERYRKGRGEEWSERDLYEMDVY